MIFLISENDLDQSDMTINGNSKSYNPSLVILW